MSIFLGVFPTSITIIDSTTVSEYEKGNVLPSPSALSIDHISKCSNAVCYFIRFVYRYLQQCYLSLAGLLK